MAAARKQLWLGGVGSRALPS